MIDRMKTESKITAPRDEDSTVSGNLGLVAICVTQPLWPLNVPLRWSCSVIMPINLTVCTDAIGLIQAPELPKLRDAGHLE